MDAKAYDRFTEAICTRLMPDDRVIALIALGSIAAADRRDQWSDHDFRLITRPGNAAVVRQQIGGRNARSVEPAR